MINGILWASEILLVLSMLKYFMGEARYDLGTLITILLRRKNIVNQTQLVHLLLKRAGKFTTYKNHNVYRKTKTIDVYARYFETSYIDRT